MLSRFEGLWKVLMRIKHLILKKIKTFPTWERNHLKKGNILTYSGTYQDQRSISFASYKDMSCLPNPWYWLIIEEIPFLRFYWFCFACACFACMYICEACACSTHRGQQRSLEIGKSQCGCCKPNLGSLKREPLPLISELSL